VPQEDKVIFGIIDGGKNLVADLYRRNTLRFAGSNQSNILVESKYATVWTEDSSR
jgi:hypothetical protein